MNSENFRIFKFREVQSWKSSLTIPNEKLCFESHVLKSLGNTFQFPDCSIRKKCFSIFNLSSSESPISKLQRIIKLKIFFIFIYVFCTFIKICIWYQNYPSASYFTSLLSSKIGFTSHFTLMCDFPHFEQVATSPSKVSLWPHSHNQPTILAGFLTTRA